ncbi:unnamed protein product [Acanthosepion pharaonis]|uniref:Uncharacterized protein n=1 Tax=Acanthosepion pharaonis TaxID=158019 RepID=A0A812E182_ACAPH|nr:unnamed protein product [Sepia pharaonis]
MLNDKTFPTSLSLCLSSADSLSFLYHPASRYLLLSFFLSFPHILFLCFSHFLSISFCFFSSIFFFFSPSRSCSPPFLLCLSPIYYLPPSILFLSFPPTSTNIHFLPFSRFLSFSPSYISNVFLFLLSLIFLSLSIFSCLLFSFFFTICLFPHYSLLPPLSVLLSLPTSHFFLFPRSLLPPIFPFLSLYFYVLVFHSSSLSSSNSPSLSQSFHSIPFPLFLHLYRSTPRFFILLSLSFCSFFPSLSLSHTSFSPSLPFLSFCPCVIGNSMGCVIQQL